jgi:hypothetical protein
MRRINSGRRYPCGLCEPPAAHRTPRFRGGRAAWRSRSARVRTGTGRKSVSNSCRRPSAIATLSSNSSEHFPVSSKRFNDAAVTPARLASVCRVNPSARRKAFARAASNSAASSGNRKYGQYFSLSYSLQKITTRGPPAGTFALPPPSGSSPLLRVCPVVGSTTRYLRGTSRGRAMPKSPPSG